MKNKRYERIGQGQYVINALFVQSKLYLKKIAEIFGFVLEWPEEEIIMVPAKPVLTFLPVAEPLLLVFVNVNMIVVYAPFNSEMYKKYVFLPDDLLNDITNPIKEELVPKAQVTK